MYTMRLTAVFIGLLLATISIVGCGIVEGKVNKRELKESEPNEVHPYICTYTDEYSNGVYYRQLEFYRTDDDKTQFLEDIERLQYAYLKNGCDVGCIGYTEDFDKAQFVVSDDKPIPEL